MSGVLIRAGLVVFLVAVVWAFATNNPETQLPIIANVVLIGGGLIFVGGLIKVARFVFGSSKPKAEA